MADPVGYAHAATLAATPDLAVTLAGQLREAQEAIQRVRATADDLDRHADAIEITPQSKQRFGPDEYVDGRVYGYREAARRIRRALDPPDGAA